MDEELEILRGREAQSLLGNELLNEALDALESKYDTAWKNSSLSQVNVREEAYRMLATVREIRLSLTSFVTTGKLATTAKETREETEERGRELNKWDGSADNRQ
jgi:hypothetical protein